MILVSKTYEVITQESAQDGDADECGFVYEDCEMSFKELVDTMREYSEPSCSPCKGDIYTWLTQHGEMDYETGDHENFSLHYSRKNASKNAKYWKLAMIAAGFVK